MDGENKEIVKKEEDVDFSALFNYLGSEKGHELATKFMALIEGIKKVTLDKNAEMSKFSAEQQKFNAELNHKQNRNSLIIQGVVFSITICSVTYLVSTGKFDTSVGVLFGTLVGYFFGRGNVEKNR